MNGYVKKYSKRAARANANNIKNKHIVNNHSRLYYLFKGFLISIAISLPLFFIIALTINITSFPEEYMPPALLCTIFISIVVAALYSTAAAKSKGWFNGTLIGLFYCVILIIIRWCLEGGVSFTKDTLTTLLSGLLIGSTCGIAGLNIGDKIRKSTKNSKM